MIHQTLSRQLLDSNLVFRNFALADATTKLIWLARHDSDGQLGNHVYGMVPHALRESVYCIFGKARIRRTRETLKYTNGLGERIVACIDWVEECQGYMIHVYTHVNKPPLSEQQEKISRLLLKDYTLFRIAKELDIKESTVQSHLAAMREKFGCDTTWGLCAKLSSYPSLTTTSASD